MAGETSNIAADTDVLYHYWAPAGSVVAYAGGPGEPDGWLQCDGQAVSRTTYSSLFTAIGTVYGVGDGSTTFNVPDLRGRFPLGANDAALPNGIDAGLTERNEAAEGGTEAHTHEVNPDSYITPVSGDVLIVQSGTGSQVSHEDHQHTLDMPSKESTSSGTMPPFNVMNFIIKT